MINQIVKIFNDQHTIIKIQSKLPYLFQLAELESQRGGKIGMEVGTLRERILVSFLIYKFGGNNVQTEIPTTQSETDLLLFNQPISIKTRTGSGYSGVKIIWTVDRDKVLEFRDRYVPSYDIIFAQIKWNKDGGLFYIPAEAQKDVFDKLGRDQYIKLPTQGTNPRGVEITSSAMKDMLTNKQTLKIGIQWIKGIVGFNPYRRWLEQWQKK